MKPFVSLVILASISLALPIHESTSTSDTLSSSNYLSLHQISGKKTEHRDTNAPTFQASTERQRQELPFIQSQQKEFNLSDQFTQKGLFKLSKSPGPSYGVFLGKPASLTPLATTPKVSSITYLKFLDLHDLIDRHGPECVGISIFIIVPIVYCILEFFKLVFNFFVSERFPERGRRRLRLPGPEREMKSLDHLHREKILEKERFWWQGRRTR